MTILLNLVKSLIYLLKHIDETAVLQKTANTARQQDNYSQREQTKMCA